MAPPAQILRIEHLTVESTRPYDSGVWDVSLALDPGDLALLRLEPGNAHVPVADAAEGLVEPSAGTVSFLGRDWQEMSPQSSAASRGRIGRTFEGHAWVNSLDLGENIMLAQYHHTARSADAIRAEATELAVLFGLPGLPRGMPIHAHPQDLRRAACARAFMGRPDLVILERPETGIFPEIMSPLMSAVRQARARGAAVIWTTTEGEVWQDTGIRATRRLLMSGSQMLAAAG